MSDNDVRPPRGLSTTAAAAYTSISESFLEKSRIGATDVPGPRWRKVGKRVIYLKDDLDAWLDEQPAQ